MAKKMGLVSFLWLAATAVPESTQRDRQGHSICGIGIIFLDFKPSLKLFLNPFIYSINWKITIDKDFVVLGVFCAALGGRLV